MGRDGNGQVMVQTIKRLALALADTVTPTTTTNTKYKASDEPNTIESSESM